MCAGVSGLHEVSGLGFLSMGVPSVWARGKLRERFVSVLRVLYGAIDVLVAVFVS